MALTTHLPESPDPTAQPTPDPEVVLVVDRVSKRFCRDLKRSLFYGVQDICGELLGAQRQAVDLRTGEFWALKDVSFTLKRGEAIGLVGANGAGKTTLLRIISGLIKPDQGRVAVCGRVAPLIALGAGFNPILTGRENIYVNMAILGLSRAEIQARFADVINFAEIGDAIDAPVQSYSSGMAARLGFASAIFTQPDILLIDEVLAVGDIRFRAKCYRKLAELRQQGTTFVLVSHSPQLILSTCESAVYLAKGQLKFVGQTDRALQIYEESLFQTTQSSAPGQLHLPRKTEPTTTGLDITALYFQNAQGQSLTTPLTGEPVCLCINFYAHTAIQGVNIAISIVNTSLENEQTLFLESTRDGKLFDIPAGEHQILIQMPYCGLIPGLYTMKLNVNAQTYLNVLDTVEAFRFKVTSQQSIQRCQFYQPIQWDIQPVVGSSGLE